MAAGLAKPLFTIGHGAVDIDTFAEYLRDARIESLIDVRRFPGSRRHPQFGAAELSETLRGMGITYRHAEDLGGRRRPLPDSPNVGLRNEGFRGYADWMLGDTFREALFRVVEESQERRTTVMCAETPWWKCHRRLISDATVLLANTGVVHLMAAKQAAHRLTDGVAIEGGRLVYRRSAPAHPALATSRILRRR
ncbi:MAG TPA: DUF488 domain-containing protein [Candidatus Baltobacteraceae bacterium]|nr:DUF488 domain-containing protein [Candidatus Baltobacteraceae bacterium]